MDRSRRRPRLALLHYTAPPVTGGVEAILEAHTRLLRRAGYDVRVVAGRGDAHIIPELDSTHPEVLAVTHALQAGVVPATFSRLADRIEGRLRDALRDRDLVIAHNVLTMPFNLPLAAALRRLPLPRVAWTHDLVWTNSAYVPFQRVDWPWGLTGRAAPGVRYVAISHTRRREMVETMGIDPDAVPVVPNGIDVLEFGEVGQHARDLLRRAGAAAADPLLLVPQRVTARKRLQLAIETAAALVPRWPDLRVVVTGPVDPHHLACRRYADKLLELRARLGLDHVVRFLYELAGEGGCHPVCMADVAQLYRVSDVVLIPSESEGFGLPLLEAAVARVPLVCSDIPVFREVADGGVELFPRHANGEEIAAVVDRVLRSRSVRHRRSIMERYAWSEVLTSIRGVIAEALLEGGRLCPESPVREDELMAADEVTTAAS